MEPQETQKKSNKNLGIGIAVAGLLAVLGITYATQQSNSGTLPTTTPTDVATTTTTSTLKNPSSTGKVASAATYKDGTYSATGSYMSPGGLDQLGVTVTLKADKITAVSIQQEPHDGTSARYQAMFAANYTPYVVGQDITTLKLGKVSGSSLTARGFNDAIAQIESQAKA